MSDDKKNQRNQPQVYSNENADCVDIIVPPLAKAVDIRVDMGSGEAVPIKVKCQEKDLRAPESGVILTRAGIKYMTDVLASFINNLLAQHWEETSPTETDNSEDCSGSSIDKEIEEIKRKIKNCSSSDCVFNGQRKETKPARDDENRRSSRSDIIGSICNVCMTFISEIAEIMRKRQTNDLSKTDSDYPDGDDEGEPSDKGTLNILPTNENNLGRHRDIRSIWKKRHTQLPSIIIQREGKKK